MARLSFAGWKDPARRPRYVIWSGVAVLFIAAFAVLAVGVSSSRWFCAQVCHKVQDDAMIAYNHSAHSNISCLACHMPVNADPVTFLIHKVEAGLGVIPTLKGTYEMPINAESHTALEMKSENCTQCHSANRKVTPSPGIIIDHEIHAEKGVKCTLCHNRVAHVEDFELAGKDPQTGEESHKHQDFMTMDACFRCHGLGKEAKAPGTCSACHPKGFELKPDNHDAASFFPRGHADLALADNGRVANAEAEHAAAERRDGVAYASGGGEEGPWAELKSVKSVSYCGTCHEKVKFCDGCHGMEMPHPTEFTTKSHPQTVETKAKKCAYCHKQKETKFCDDCHHGTKVQWAFNKKTGWKRQHADAVTEKGVKACLGACHEVKFCSDCHTKEKPLPSSHKAGNWLRDKATMTVYGTTPAKPSGTHALNAQKEITACEVCHGTGGTKSKFCQGCHKLAMPHEAQFKEFHSGTGRKNPKVCSNCHTFKELCSNCHHKGASTKVAWTKKHPSTVDNGGANQCFEKCHKDKQFCVSCHTKSNAVPSSHKAKGWTRRASLSKPAGHQTAYKKANDSCVYCHGEGGVQAKFCSNCHKMPMPHAIDAGNKQKFLHKDGFKDKKLSKKACQNCHSQRFCDNCHHVGSSPKVPWAASKAGVKVQHAKVVQDKGAQPCFECHQETYCSYCHVRLSR